jgi:sec-independent protein translocase protein TatA
MFRNPTTDLIVVLVIVLLIFGPKRLPGLGKQLGQGLREFKDSITGDSDDDGETQRPEISRTAAPPVAPPAGSADPVAAQPARDPAERTS